MVLVGFKREAIKGIGWVGALRTVTRAATLVKTAVLARLLTPFDFGLFGIVALSLSFFETLTETGINQVLIQSDRQAKELVDSAWVISIVRGIVIGVLIACSAIPLSSFYHNPQIVQLSLLIALVPVIKGFINPMIVEFQKELRFSGEFWFRFVIILIDICVSVIAAFALKSVYSFIIAMLAASIAEVALSFFWCKVRPVFQLVRKDWIEIVSFGKWVTLSGVAHWVASDLDDVVVGRMFGTAPLGIYQAAYKISSLPVTEISGTVNQVSFPVLSKLKEDKEKLFSAFRTSVLATVTVSGLISFILLAFPDTVVDILLGPQWAQAVPLIRLLALFGFLRSIESSIQPLFLAIGRPRVASIGNLLKVIALIVGLVLWSASGLRGVALSALVSVIAIIPYYSFHVMSVMTKRG